MAMRCVETTLKPLGGGGWRTAPDLTSPTFLHWTCPPHDIARCAALSCQPWIALDCDNFHRLHLRRLHNEVWDAWYIRIFGTLLREHKRGKWEGGDGMTTGEFDNNARGRRRQRRTFPALLGAFYQSRGETRGVVLRGKPVLERQLGMAAVPRTTGPTTWPHVGEEGNHHNRQCPGRHRNTMTAPLPMAPKGQKTCQWRLVLF